ncbi:hypothetical protein LXL04_035939 [Taraxacum kok-saghyz]
MMNRSSSKDSLVGAGGRNYNNTSNHNAMTNGILPHRRGMSFTKNNSAENFNTSNNVDLFSRSRTSLPAASSDESDLQVRLARLSVGSAKPAKSILDDLLSSNEGGKNDYDWLLTPPGTPLVPSSEGKESQQPARVTTRSRSTVRSSSISKTSRLSVSQSESNNNNSYPSRPARSSSVTRSSISTTQYTTNYSTRNTNILNTSSASVSSYIRPSTPTRTARPSTPSSTRTTPSRTSTPSRTRPTPTPTPSRPTQPTRPSTPTSRPQTPGNSTTTTTTTTPTIRSSSRSSTPTRRTLTPSLTPSTSSLTSGPRGVSNGPRSVGSGSRPSSPSPRVRPPPQPMNISDFSHETPPNLRTTLPDRPLSAGRSRPGASLKGNLDNSPSPNTTGTITRRHSSPSVIRGRVHPEPSGRTRPNSNGHVVESLDPRRTSSHLPQSLTRKPVKPSNSENGSTGFGRNISKKSLDMAIKHMDIRNGGVRPLSGSTLFPQSIRSTNSRAHPPARASSVDGGGSENGSYSNGYSWNRERGSGPGPGPGPMEDESPHSSYKLSSEVDIYESSRYDAILLKEDLKNTSWLHTADDKNDEGFLFDNGFESLPEPFSPL